MAEPNSDALPELVSSETASGVRFGVLALLGALSFVLYIDRICISRAAPDIQRELGISKPEMGWVFSAFTIAYCLFEVPTGRWGDRFGSRGVLARIVLWWSAFTALTGFAFGMVSLMIVRFLFGAGEAGAYPNTARVLTRWFPPTSRGRAQGLIIALAQVGAAVAPIACDQLIQRVGWRGAFGVFGALGVVWVVPFYAWFRDNPRDHPAVNAAELRLLESERPAAHSHNDHPPIPWALILRTPNIWLLGGVISCTAFNSYFYFTWYQTYLQEARGQSPTYASALSSLVLSASALGSLCGGFLLDRLTFWSGDRRRSRSWQASGGLLLAALLLTAGTQIDAAVPAAVCTAFAAFSAFLAIPAWWSAVTEVSGRHVGAVFGLLNSLGGVGAVASPIFLGWFVDWMEKRGHTLRDQWDHAFPIYSFVLLLGACGWLLIDSTKSIDEGELPPME